MQEGRCAPRVQIHEQGETVELSRMTFCPGRADIFFPVHFHLAQALTELYLQSRINSYEEQSIPQCKSSCLANKDTQTWIQSHA